VKLPPGSYYAGWICPAVYRPRRSRDSPLYHLVERHYEQVEGFWEERFERR
jgi:hypothetical protein